MIQNINSRREKICTPVDNDFLALGLREMAHKVLG